MIDTRAVMRSLPLVASVLGRKYGVQVEMGGADAYTDGKTIHLPALPSEVPDTLLAMARGYLDHEAAHVRETDFSRIPRHRFRCRWPHSGHAALVFPVFLSGALPGLGQK